MDAEHRMKLTSYWLDTAPPFSAACSTVGDLGPVRPEQQVALEQCE